MNLTMFAYTLYETQIFIMVEHHCSHRSCLKSKSTCPDHYWTYEGVDVAYDATRVFEKKACERNVKRDGKER
jgi:hypothetical protein